MRQVTPFSLPDHCAPVRPLVATLALGAMNDFALSAGQSIRDEHVAGYPLESSILASAVRDFGTFETHEAYEARFQRRANDRQTGRQGSACPPDV